MSSTISFKRAFCPSVRRNGRIARADSRMRSSTVMILGFDSCDRRAFPQRQPELKQKELLEDQADLRRRSKLR